tara:strand:- start:22790 stop:23422 length:633 start_codon:yes stop_codon:yes gene_type:complete
MQADPHIAKLSELAFLEEYEHTVLSKPQIVADTTLRSLAFCPPYERTALIRVLADQLVEAAKRLAAVFEALDDRQLSVATTLRGPLPGAPAWVDLTQLAATAEPEGLVRRMALDEGALESAAQLRSLPLPDWLPDLIQASSAEDSLAMTAPIDQLAITGTTAEGEQVEVRLAAGENATVAMADLVADLCSVARGFLGAYLRARRSLGQVV